MIDRILAAFPPHIHALTLVSDPDGLLTDEIIRGALAARGFRLVDEPDPLALRHQVEQARPWSAAQPLLIRTAAPLNTLPYDLWQRGLHIELDLHRFFPTLDYAVLRELGPTSRGRLAVAQADLPPPAGVLAANATRAYLIHAVWDLDLARPVPPARLIAWLADYHRRDPLPLPLLAYLVQRLDALPAYAGWPIADLLRDAGTYRRFMQTAWAATVQAQLHEPDAGYAVALPLPFDTDPALQEALPHLIRSGTLTPVEVPATAYLPDWAQPAVVPDPTDPRLVGHAAIKQVFSQA